MGVDILQVLCEFHRCESVDREHDLELSNGTISDHLFSSTLALVSNPGSNLASRGPR